jgi:hypothetical protein
MKRNHAVGIFIFAFAVCLGTVAAVVAWGGKIFVSNAKYIENVRNPAAIRNVFDYSQFEGEPLKIRSLKRLITGAQVVAHQSQIGIELGHFVTKGEGGRGQLACEYYNRVTLQFEGEGVFEFGEKPVMTVEAPCQVSADINRIETIWIPHVRLMTDNREPARTIETTYQDNTHVHFKFDNMTSVWPREWTLVSVRLFSDTSEGREVSISKTEIANVVDHPFTIKF